jgi:hypothetical protein
MMALYPRRRMFHKYGCESPRFRKMDFKSYPEGTDRETLHEMSMKPEEAWGSSEGATRGMRAAWKCYATSDEVTTAAGHQQFTVTPKILYCLAF